MFGVFWAILCVHACSANGHDFWKVDREVLGRLRGGCGESVIRCIFLSGERMSPFFSNRS